MRALCALCRPQADCDLKNLPSIEFHFKGLNDRTPSFIVRVCRVQTLLFDVGLHEDRVVEHGAGGIY